MFVPAIDFCKCFVRLTGNQPFGWQQEFFKCLITDSVPEECDVPTGLGKTSVIAIWLLALAESLIAERTPRIIPLRLAYVVDRRVIVDQSTEEARHIISNLEEAESEDKSAVENPLTMIGRALRKIAFVKDGPLVALSALRGQMAESRDWCLDPSRPAIIIGTVDMIGSRLLFSGYGGLGRSHRSLQAGLIGQDTLLLIDEAHLSPAFVATMKDVQNEIHRFRSISPFKVLPLSATIRSGNARVNPGSGQQPLFDERKELVNSIARDRLCAKKYLEWVPFKQPIDHKMKTTHKNIQTKIADIIVECAIQYEGQPLAIVIFASTVALVNELGEKLINNLGKASSDRVLKLTGEMRGFERDRLMESDKFRIFLPQRKRDILRATHYLIATSCAEVGINLDGDQGICDMSSLDSMIQRFGRINRFGTGNSKISVVLDETAITAATSDIIREIGYKRKILNLDRRIKCIKLRLHDQQEVKRSSKTKGEKAAAHTAIEGLNAELKAAEKARKELEITGVKYDENLAHAVRMDRTLFYTWRLLKRRPSQNGRIDCSPLALRSLPHDLRAWPKDPVRPVLDSARLDDWSMTSLRQSEFPRPLVSFWLRGVMADETAQTALCWRADLNFATSAQQAIDMGGVIGITPQERAVLATHRAESFIKELAKHSPDRLVVVINSTGDIEAYKLQTLVEKKEALFGTLAYASVIIPSAIGGLSIDGNVLNRIPKRPVAVLDVVNEDDWTRYTVRMLSDGDYEIAKIEESGHLSEQMHHSSLKDALSRCANQSGGICENSKMLQEAFLENSDAQEEVEEHQPEPQVQVAYFLNRKSSRHYLRDGDDLSSLGMGSGRTVDGHNADVGRYVMEIARKIGLDDEMVATLGLAGFNHDDGKDRDWWQAAIGNPRVEGANWKPLAKTVHNRFNDGLNQHYRHEFGSLVEIQLHDDLRNHSNCDLIMHLVAAHHGYGRPHFPKNAFDRSHPSAVNTKIAEQEMHRFVYLQRKYGWWQLAYIEALLKAADALASREFSRGKL